MTRRVLLTGATGFVGRQILRAFQDKGVPVRLVVRDGREPAPGLRSADEVVATPDLFAEDADWWVRAMEGIDTVVHSAWYAEPGRYLDSPLNLDCLSGTLAMAQGALRAGLRRFVGIGTCFEYDLSAANLDLDTPLRPTSPYAGAKAGACLALSQILPSSGVEFAWCRLFYLYGEGEDPRRFVPYLNDRLSRGEPAELTSGHQVRDYLDVAAAGRIIASVAGGDIQGPVNVCSGRPVTVRQMAEAIADRYGRRDLLRFGVRPDNAVDPMRVVGVPTLPTIESLEPW